MEFVVQTCELLVSLEVDFVEYLRTTGIADCVATLISAP